MRSWRSSRHERRFGSNWVRVGGTVAGCVQLKQQPESALTQYIAIGSVGASNCVYCPLPASPACVTEEDRRERRRKLGLPEELTEEEKKREQERLAELTKQEEAKKAFTSVKPITGKAGPG